MDRLQSLRLTMTLDDPDLLGVRCSTLRSSLGEDLDSFFPKFDESISQEVHDCSDLFFDDGAATDVKVDQLQRMLAVDKFNKSKDNHHHQKLAQEFCMESMTTTKDEENLFVDQFNTFNAEQLKRMLDPLKNSFNLSDVTIPLEDETKSFRNTTSVTDSPTLPYNSVHENTTASDGHSYVEATIQYELCETKLNVENDETMYSKKRKLSTVIENLAKKIKFDHR